MGAAKRSSQIRAWSASLALLAAAGFASLLGNRLIIDQFPDRPTPRDLLFEVLPYVAWTRYLTVVALAVGFSLFLYYAVRYERQRIPAFSVGQSVG